MSGRILRNKNDTGWRNVVSTEIKLHNRTQSNKLFSKLLKILLK